MKYLNNFLIFEMSDTTDKNVANKLKNRIKSYDVNKNYRIDIRRPSSGMFGKGEGEGKSYRVSLIDKKTNKVVSVAYLMSIKENESGIQAEVRRVHTDKKYRGKGLAGIVFREMINNFGDLYLYLYASPNRIDDLTDENREGYREKLFKFYGKYGFKRTPGERGSTHKMVRNPKKG
jgi:GNAT superfamily N-acetyltransferase